MGYWDSKEGVPVARATIRVDALELYCKGCCGGGGRLYSGMPLRLQSIKGNDMITHPCSKKTRDTDRDSGGRGRGRTALGRDSYSCSDIPKEEAPCADA